MRWPEESSSPGKSATASLWRARWVRLALVALLLLLTGGPAVFAGDDSSWQPFIWPTQPTTQLAPPKPAAALAHRPARLLRPKAPPLTVASPDPDDIVPPPDAALPPAGAIPAPSDIGQL